MAVVSTKAQLHPLVLLSITDTISRDITRGRTYPFLGGIVGQVTREGISLEHAFDVKLKPTDDGAWQIDEDYFKVRLWQMQEVHKEPAQLDFVGFWTLGKADAGPGPELKHIMPEMLKRNENALCLMFNADTIVNGAADETRMPFVIYECVQDQQSDAADDKDMDTVDPELSFRVVEWEMATEEAELISLEFVKNGAGNATRVRTGAGADALSSSTTAQDEPSAKGLPSTKNGTKDEKKPQKTARAAAADLYTPEEEEMLSFLTTRANATRTLLNRLNTIKAYLDQSGADASPELLRAVKAMLARLPSIEAAKAVQQPKTEESSSKDQPTATGATADAGMTDTLLVELLGGIGKSLHTARDLGGKFAAVEAGRRDGRRQRDGYMDFPSGLGGGPDAMDLT